MDGKDRSAQELIEQLRAEIDQAEFADDTRRERLDRLVGRLDEQLAEGREEHHELAEELRDEALEFGVEHPQIAAVLRNVMRMLSSIGI